LLINRVQPPFDNPDLRRAMSLTIDRNAYIDTLGQGEGEIGGILQPSPAGLWGMPPEQIADLPGTASMCRRTEKRPAPWCESSATAPTTGSRSR
jgi:ABC-type transport system substrate-binding protein